jgi:hypothetical protein
MVTSRSEQTRTTHESGYTESSPPMKHKMSFMVLGAKNEFDQTGEHLNLEFVSSCRDAMPEQETCLEGRKGLLVRI